MPGGGTGRNVSVRSRRRDGRRRLKLQATTMKATTVSVGGDEDFGCCSHSDDRRSRELSSDFSEKHNDQVIEQLEISIHRRDELQEELDHLEDKIEEKEQLVSDLQKKSQKLEEAVAATRKLTSQRQSLLAKLHKGFLQVQEYTEKLKTSEQELQMLVDNVAAEVHVGEDAGPRDG